MTKLTELQGSPEHLFNVLSGRYLGMRQKQLIQTLLAYGWQPIGKLSVLYSSKDRGLMSIAQMVALTYLVPKGPGFMLSPKLIDFLGVDMAEYAKLVKTHYRG